MLRACALHHRIRRHIAFKELLGSLEITNALGSTTLAAPFAASSKQFGRSLATQASPSSGESDVLVVGAGHNGLVSAFDSLSTAADCVAICPLGTKARRVAANRGRGLGLQVAATLLAQQGLRVKVLEEKSIVGGACRTEYPFKKAPGLPQSTGACSSPPAGGGLAWLGAQRCPAASASPASPCCVLRYEGQDRFCQQIVAVRPASRSLHRDRSARSSGASPGAYLLGVMPPELLSLLQLDLPLRRRDPHYFLPTRGERHGRFSSPWAVEPAEGSRAVHIQFCMPWRCSAWWDRGWSAAATVDLAPKP